MSQREHVPVLLLPALEFLDIARKGTYIDCTLGMGGHALEILRRNTLAKIIGFDIDAESLEEAKKKLVPFANRVRLFQADFRLALDLNIPFSNVRGVLFDLGISSYQLDSPQRGFSYNLDGPLDMRMDTRNKLTAQKIIASYTEPKLAQLFWEYGELKQSRKLARRIVSQRKIQPLETTQALRLLVEDVCQWRPQKGKLHPAAKVFQALRIEVNQELKELAAFLENLAHRLPRRARIVAISFHSLEDRIIKHTFLRLAAPEQGEPLLRVLTKKPVTPAEAEIAFNPRCHSAKLRAAERI
jgi:16S rRNA (cytosine1402-N4)-methyltransferase